MIDLRVSLVLGLSRLFGHGPLARFGTRNTAQTASAESMIADRTAAVPLYHHLFSRFCDFSGKTVVELGCSRGYLLAEFLASGRFHAIGVDRDSRALAAGAARYGPDITFVQSSEETIPLPDASCDHAFTVDVIEHLSHPGAIFREMHRILRPGGRFLIYFHPWLGPYGAHLGDIVPFPWPHVLFSMDVLYRAAARRYESAADGDLPFTRRDPVTGQRKANPFLDNRNWQHYLNPDMTIRGFRRFVTRTPFHLVHLERIGFGGRGVPVARLLRPLAHVPFLDELFTSGVFSVLER